MIHILARTSHEREQSSVVTGVNHESAVQKVVNVFHAPFPHDGFVFVGLTLTLDA